MELNQKFPIGTCQLIWFTNPDSLPPGSNYPIGMKPKNLPPEPIGLGSKFYTNKEAALENVFMYSGDWVIFELMFQNPDPEDNYFWKLLEHGAWEKFKNNSFGR